MADIAQLTVVLNADDQLSPALDKATRELQSTHKAMLAVGGAMTAIGVAGVAAFKGAIDAAADFESAMSGIKAVLGGAEWAQFGDQLDALAKQLGKDTVFSANEAAVAISELLKAGVKVEDVLGGAAKAATSLAAAGGVPIKEAAEIAAAALNVFNLAGSDMAKVADTISGAVNASAIEMSDFRIAFQQSGSAARQEGQSFDELTVAIAALGQAGVKSSDAGTSLRVFLSRLVPGTKEATAAFQELGLITEAEGNRFFDAAGKAKTFTEVAGILNTALEGLTDEERIAKFDKAFGQDASRAAGILGRAGAAGMNELAAAMRNVTAESVANTKLDNFAGSMKNLQGSVETLAITIGQRLTPILRTLADTVKGLVDGFMALPASIQTTVVLFAGVATAVTGITGAVIAAQGALALLGVSFGALVAVAAPLVLAVAGISLAIGALVVAWQNDWNGIQTTTLRVIEHIQPVLEHFGQLLGPLFEAAGQAVGTFFTALASGSADGASAVETAGNTIIKVFHDDLAPAVDTAVAALDHLSFWFGFTLGEAIEVATTSWTAFWDQVGPTIEAAWAIAEPIFDLLARGYRELLGGALEAASSALNTWLENWKTGLATVAGVLGPIAELVGGKAAEINAALQAGLQAMAPAAQVATDAAGDAIEAEVTATGVEVRALATEVGHELAAGLIKGLDEVTPQSVATVRAHMRAIMQAAKAEAEITSPSALFAREVGAPLAAGIGAGFAAGMGPVAAGMAGVIRDLAEQGRQLLTLGSGPWVAENAAQREFYQRAAERGRAESYWAGGTFQEPGRSQEGVGPAPFGIGGWHMGGRGMPSSSGLTGGGGGGTLGGGDGGAGGADVVLTLQAATTAGQAFLGVQDGIRASVQQTTPVVQALTDAYAAYTAAALGANSLNTRVLHPTQSSGMQIPVSAIDPRGPGGGAEGMAIYADWLQRRDEWARRDREVQPTPYYPTVNVTMATPPALITPTSDLELRATADKLAPLVADALHRTGTLGFL